MYWGAYWGLALEATSEEETEEPTPEPLPVPVTHDDPEYVDHVAQSLDRLPQQFRGDPEEV